MSAGETEDPPARVYYGWRIVGVAFVTHCLSVGTVFYAFGVFFHPLSDAFGWTRAEISWGFSISAVVGALYGPLFGRWVDRSGPRAVQLFGAAMLGVAFAALSRIESLVQFYLCMGGLVALGSASLGPVPSNTAVARWFVRRRGRALGIATAGISMGGVVFVPVTQAMIDAFGWRSAFLGLAVIVVGIGAPPIALWMRSSPESMGLRPDGDPAPVLEGGAAEAYEAELERSVHPDEAVRQSTFWILSIAFGLTVAGLSAVLLHQIPYLLDQGVEPSTASWVLGGTAAVGVVGKLGFGALIDRFDQKRVIALCFLAQALGVVLLYTSTTPWMLTAYVLVYGYAMGGNATLQATIVGECFGRLHYGAIAGRMTPIIIGMQAVGVPFVGWVHDRTGSYALAFAAVVSGMVAAATAIATLRLPQRRVR